MACDVSFRPPCPSFTLSLPGCASCPLPLAFQPCALRLCKQFLLCRLSEHLYRPCSAYILLVKGDLSAKQNCYLYHIIILELENAGLNLGIHFWFVFVFFLSLCTILKYIVLDYVQLVYFLVHNLSCGPGTLQA
jgi:hypothetical protein